MENGVVLLLSTLHETCDYDETFPSVLLNHSPRELRKQWGPMRGICGSNVHGK